jgi:hypothetical protein
MSSSPTKGQPRQLLSGDLSGGGGLFFNFEKNTRSASALVRHKYVRKFDFFLISKKNTHSARITLPTAHGLVRYR